jgi:BirA family transcriptional regulator, biotin operon repressor / biotin---[acetyl-CoA-carboxylase] ligase
MIGFPHVHHRLTDSTNERARRLAAAGAVHGTLVTADEQTAGRGRQGRAWVAPPGRALLMSVVLHVDERTPLAPLAAAVAVCHAFPEPNGIKWPNDVWIDGRKVAGILIEGRPQEGWAVLGIGLNVATAADEFPADLRDIATSLRAAGASSPTTPGEALDELVPALDAWLAAPPEAVLGEWRERDALVGQRVRWNGGEGVAAGVDDEGSLLVETDDGVQSLHAGEVHLQR